jgi:dipeptidyl aminopeptidase/acylaminoacyl peptidase
MAISADGGNLRRVTPEGYCCSTPVVSPHGDRIAVFARSFSTLSEIWPRCITSCSQALEGLSLPSIWIHSWKTDDGVQFDGIVIDPPGGRCEDAPILVWTCVDERGWAIVHLEPQTSNCGFLLQSIAQQGFRVFIPSHRLTGLAGLEHVRDHFLNAGMAADVVSGILSLKQELGSNAPVVSFGQSIGGGITCEILVAYPEVLSAAVVTGLGADYSMVYGIFGRTNVGMRKTFGGPPWVYPQRYLDVSPVRGTERITCPVLLMMGSEDEEVPSAKQFYAALREAGKDVTFLALKGAAHWPKEPKQVAMYVQTAVNWLKDRVRPGAGA